MDSHEISKGTDVSVDDVPPQDAKTGSYEEEKNVSQAYPATTREGDGRSLRVPPLPFFAPSHVPFQTLAKHNYLLYDVGSDCPHQRLFSFAQLLAFSLTFMESWEVMAINISATFWNGGPRSLVWGAIAVIIGSLAQAYSMAELGSILPIAGAQYHWTHIMAPERSRRFITWMQAGWVTWFAWVSALAGSSSGEAALLQALIAENVPGYDAKRWHLTLIMWALLISSGLINTYTFWLVPWLELASGIMHVLLFVVFMIVLLVLSPKSSTDFVWSSSSVLSGWDRSSFVAFNLGMLVPAWGFIGFDGVVHMSEEVRRAKHAVPRSMVLSIAINGTMAFAIVLVLLYCIGNVDDALDASYPIIPICFNATGSMKATNAMVSSLIILTYFVVAASVASVSRITWAWARDGALPRRLAVIDPKLHVPVNATWLPIVIVCLLALFQVGSTTGTAFSAFTALSSLGLYTSYIIAISCILHARLTGRLSDDDKAPNHQDAQAQVSYGAWRMWPGFATPVNVFALLWTVYLTVWLPFPTSLPVTGTNMNYALPIYAFVVLLALGSWFVWGQRHWKGLDLRAIGMVEAHD
ncbi:amino acid permease [Cladophialophora carrionii]|uniref:Amino acid permease n=1 Tax=Cladophialophora carrionii TaxID=86049 RepID=A0A1C1CAT4_9EURO|nr:amino acid permease [Cladophialophora carrionii]